MMKWIKILTIYVCLITLLWGCDLTPQFLQTTPTPKIELCFDCVRLETTINKHSFTQSEPITITVTLRKIIEKPHVQYFQENTPMKTYIIETFDQTGAEVPLTQAGRETYASGYRILQNLTPGYPFSETFNIAPWYQWSQSGVYTVTVKDVVLGEGDNKRIPLTSPPLTFTLTTD